MGLVRQIRTELWPRTHVIHRQAKSDIKQIEIHNFLYRAVCHACMPRYLDACKAFTAIFPDKG